MAHIQKRDNGKYLVRWQDGERRERSKQFTLKRDASAFKAEIESQLNRGDYIDPAKTKITLGEWCEVWLRGQRMHRASTYRQAATHVKRISTALGHRPIGQVTVSEVRAWIGALQAEGLKPSTVAALHGRLKQILDAAVDEGVLRKNPVGRKTSPKTTSTELTIPTTEQVWALHDAMPEGLRPAILLGAFAGLRNAEAVALRIEDVDFMRGEITPKIQHGGGELKTESSRWTIPIAEDLVLELSKYAGRGRSNTLVQSIYGESITPNRLQVHVSEKAKAIAGVPEGFRFHDLRHYFASLLISEGLDILTVQRCMRHAKASTTLNVYGHMWPDAAEAPRAAVTKLFAARRASGVEKQTG